MNNKLKRAILFSFLLTNYSLGQAYANVQTMSSITIDNGEHKEISNNDTNTIDTNVNDSYAISVNNGDLVAHFDSLNIEHNINRSNKFIGIISDGSLGLSNINITTEKNLSVDIQTTETDSISGISAKNQAGLDLKSNNGDIDVNLNLKIGVSSRKENNAIEVLDKSNMNITGNNINIGSNLSSTNSVYITNKGLNISNATLNINAKNDVNITATASGRTYSNYGIYIQDMDKNASDVKIISSNNFNLIATDNNSRNESFGIYVENYEDSNTLTNLLIQSKNNTLVAQDTVIDAIGEKTNISLIATDGSNILSSTGRADSTGIEINDNANVYLEASENNIISGDYSGIHISYADDINSNVKIKGKNNQINAIENSILSFSNGVIDIEATLGNNELNSQYFTISLLDKSSLIMNAENGINSFNVHEGIALFLDNSKAIITGNGNYIDSAEALISMGNSELNLSGKQKNNLINAGEFGIYTKTKGQVTVSNIEGNNAISVQEGIGISGNDSNVQVTNNLGSNYLSVTKGIGIEANNGASITLFSNTGSNILKTKNEAIAINVYNIDDGNTGNDSNTNVELSAKSNAIDAGIAIKSLDHGQGSIIATNGDNLLLSLNQTIMAQNGSKISLSAEKGSNLLQNSAEVTIDIDNSNLIATGQNNRIINKNDNGTSLNLNNDANVNITATKDNLLQGNINVYGQSKLQISGLNNYFSGAMGVDSNTKSDIQIDAKGNNIISTKNTALNLDNTVMNVIAQGSNLIHNQEDIAIDSVNSNLSISGNVNNISSGNSVDQEYYSGSAIALDNSSFSLQGNYENIIGGSLIAKNSAKSIIEVLGNNGMNYISSSNYIDTASNTVGAIYATDKAKINLLANKQGQLNYIAVKKNLANDTAIALLADSGAIEITGTTVIDATDKNNIALLATTSTTENGSITADFNANSNIKGKIIAENNANISLKVADSNNNLQDHDLILNGDINASNGGAIDLASGNRSIITGNLNDYFYKKYLTTNLYDSITPGQISIVLGDNNRLNVVGQSFFSNLTTGQNAIIDMVAYNQQNVAHSLMIDNLDGNATFAMHLTGDKAKSDMFYLNNGQGNYNLILDEAVTTEDIGANGLRFATVGNGDNQKFINAFAYDSGAFNVEYIIGSDDYNSVDDNDEYNNESVASNGELTVNKPGSNIVDNVFQNKDTATNYKLIGIKEKQISSAGKTILNMTKANYNMAVYMSRLDKRLGEAQYITDNDGLWYKMRHEKIDKTSMFTIDSNMYEIGYDKLFNTDKGKHRVGVAVDYMKGTTHYDDIVGGGESNRKGIWFYDTWLGDDGHYSDYVFKWGRLENTFDIYGENKDNLITGEYDNNVYSLSAEYGYKQNLKDDWYITPQVQLQYAKVSSANYITNQNTDVSVDGINSLIGRLGFRIGKDFKGDMPSTLYVKADILHEFLGDQFVSVKDNTTDDEPIGFNYEHKGTWYDLGIGFNIVTSENSYVFLDYERRFGNDNDGSYQINGGINWLL